MTKATTFFIALLFYSYASIIHAAEYSLTVQPIMSQSEIKRTYQPLADYLSKQTGHTIKLVTHRNFTFYWNKMRKQRKGFDLVLDAAHFTDFRVQRQGYTVLAKLPHSVSFSVITHEDNFILDVDELISKRIATMPSPSLGAMRLEELFPNPVRIPLYIYNMNTKAAVDSVLSGKVDAAIIPTRLASQYDGINTVMTTEPVPHMAISASPNVPAEAVKKIHEALLNAINTEEGKKMLKAISAENFEDADNAMYNGYATLLEGVFGYY